MTVDGVVIGDAECAVLVTFQIKKGTSKRDAECEQFVPDSYRWLC